MNKQRAVYLMLFPDKCWHEPGEQTKQSFGRWWTKCKHCSVEVWHSNFYNPDLTTWQGFGIMWEQAQTMEWWMPFLKWLWVHEDQYFLGRMNIGVKFINPETFMNLLYEFGIASERIKEES